MAQTGHTERLLAIIDVQNRIAADRLDLDSAMQLVVDQARTLTGADAVVLELAVGDEMVYAASAGTVTEPGGAQSVIAAPLLHDERQAGELKAYSATWQAFESIDSETLGLLSGIAAAQLARSGSFSDESGLRDAVTGLGNRRAYEEQLAAECSRARRHGHALTLCLLELDGFDQVIESHGRPAADEILRQVGSTLGRLRTEDMPFRIGDGEFSVVLPATTSEHATVPVQRLAAHIASRSFGAVTATFGLADGPLDPTELHSAAEQRLREVKAQQRDGAVRA